MIYTVIWIGIVLQIVLAALLIYMIWNEEKIKAFERRLFRKIAVRCKRKKIYRLAKKARKNGFVIPRRNKYNELLQKAKGADRWMRLN